MDTEIDSKLDTYNKQLEELPALAQSFLSTAKNTDDHSARNLTSIYRQYDQAILQAKDISQNQSRVIIELETRVNQLMMQSSLIKQSLSKIIPAVEEKSQRLDKMTIPDLTSIINDKIQVEKDILKVKNAVSLHINISKIKWDKESKEGISGKILKDNIAVPFRFSNQESDKFKICNELWEMLD